MSAYDWMKKNRRVGVNRPGDAPFYHPRKIPKPPPKPRRRYRRRYRQHGRILVRGLMWMPS